MNEAKDPWGKTFVPKNFKQLDSKYLSSEKFTKK